MKKRNKLLLLISLLVAAPMLPSEIDQNIGIMGNCPFIGTTVAFIPSEEAAMDAKCLPATENTSGITNFDPKSSSSSSVEKLKAACSTAWNGLTKENYNHYKDQAVNSLGQAGNVIADWTYRPVLDGKNAWKNDKAKLVVGIVVGAIGVCYIVKVGKKYYNIPKDQVVKNQVTDDVVESNNVSKKDSMLVSLVKFEKSVKESAKDMAAKTGYALWNNKGSVFTTLGIVGLGVYGSKNPEGRIAQFGKTVRSTMVDTTGNTFAWVKPYIEKAQSAIASGATSARDTVYANPGTTATIAGANVIALAHYLLPKTSTTEHDSNLPINAEVDTSVATKSVSNEDTKSEASAQEGANNVVAEIAAQEEANRLAAEKAVQEEANRLAAEKAVQEEANRLAAEKAVQEEANRLAAEKAVQEEANRLAAEKAAQEEANRLAVEKAAQEEANRLVAEKAEAEKVAQEEASKEAIRNIAIEEYKKALDDSAKARTAYITSNTHQNEKNYKDALKREEEAYKQFVKITA